MKDCMCCSNLELRDEGHYEYERHYTYCPIWGLINPEEPCEEYNEN